MIETTEHLSESAQTALTLPVEERIRRIRSPRWIGYSRAQAILNKLETLLTHPKIHRMPGLLLVGETNAGKTMIANRFAQRYPARDNIEGEAASVPVLVIQAPPVPDENRFYVTILETLFAPYRLRDSLAGKQFQVMQLLRRVELRLLIIDEIQHILAGHATKQRQFLNVLKYLGNELQIPLVGVGTKEAIRAIQTDPQLANRFEPAVLPRWRMGREFLMLLTSFEHMLPLKVPSRLIESSLATRLLALSEGSLGELASLLTAAAVYAVRTGTERIDEHVLAAIDWVAPSERKRQAERWI